MTLTDVCRNAELTIDPTIVTDLIPTRSATYIVGRNSLQLGPFDVSKISTGPEASICPELIVRLFLLNDDDMIFDLVNGT